MHTIRVACRTRKPPASTVAAAVFGHAGTSDADDDADWERLVVSSSVQPELQVRIDERHALGDADAVDVLDDREDDREQDHDVAGAGGAHRDHHNIRPGNRGKTWRADLRVV